MARGRLSQCFFIMYMGKKCTKCFGPWGPSSGNTYIKITKKSCWDVSCLYINCLIFKVNQFILKGNWGAYRCCFVWYSLWWMTNYCYTLLFQQFVDFNCCNRGNSAVPTGNSLLFLNATISMQLLPKLPISIDQLIVNKKCNMESFGENTIIFRFHWGG